MAAASRCAGGFGLCRFSSAPVCLGHMYKHVQTAKFKDHQLALDLNSLNIWCYACSAYINIKEDFALRHPNVHSLLEALTKQKLGNQ